GDSIRALFLYFKQKSVYELPVRLVGSVLALQRFAAALCARAGADVPVMSTPRRKTRPGWPRLRNRTPGGRGGPRGVRRRARVCRSAHGRHDLHAPHAA
ncbi:hypothetical protein OIV68_32730, partial [Burkholderia pseudomallei]|nr:hypothetical protein [Burkholderia pseudomallei]